MCLKQGIAVEIKNMTLISFLHNDCHYLNMTLL